MNHMFVILFAAATCLVFLGCEEELPYAVHQTDESTDKEIPNLSEGQDDYSRVLEVGMTDLEASYFVGSEIPVTIRIKNHGPPKTNLPPRHPHAQLRPHLTVWVECDSKITSERFPLPIENRIWIKQEEMFEYTIDLSELKSFANPGEYDVAIGHQNWLVTDLGDWTGTLRSKTQTVRINTK